MKRTTGVVRARTHRLHREEYLGEAAVAFTICVDQRVRLFHDPDAVHHLAAMLRRIVAPPVFSIPIYCFMPDHLHVITLGELPQADASNAVSRFKQYGGYWLRANRPGIRWQRGYYDHIIRTPGELVTQVRYIAENPVRRGLVENWQDYPYTGSVGHELRTVIEEAGGW